MPVPDFSPGEILTASAMDSIGLWLVGGGSFANVGSFDVTGFSSTYDFYELRMSIGGVGGTTGVTGQLFQGATARNANYYGSAFFNDYFGATGMYKTTNNLSVFNFCDVNISPQTLVNGTVRGVANETFGINYQLFDTISTRSAYGMATNYNAVNNFDRIRFFGSSRNLTGYWNLYGMRK